MWLSFLLLVSTLAYGDEDCEGKGTFFAGGDWLHWKVEPQRMEFASVVTVELDSDVLLVRSKALKPKFKAQNGYRLFGGYITQDQLWTLTASYTHVPVGASVSRNMDLGTQFVSVSGIPFASASARWDAKIHYLDVDISRRFAFCEDFEIQPHIGIRGQWIHQDNKIKADSLISLISCHKTRLDGIGLEGGLFGSWNLPYGISIIGHIGGALTYCKLHNEGRLALPGIITEINDQGHVSNAWVDSFIGVAYSKNYCDYLFELHIGWEHHLILDANHFIGGNMAMQGLTLGGFVGF